MQYPHNDPNDPWSQSPLSDMPTVPMPIVPGSMPPPRGPRKATNWWGRQRKGVQASIGCGSLIVALLFCGICAAVGNAASHANTTASGATPTSGATGATGNVAVVASTTSNSPTASTNVTPGATTSTQNTGASTQPATATPTPTKGTTSSPSPTTVPTSGPTSVPETPTPGRTPTPPRPTPTPTPSCNAVNNNPWCYNFTPGALITSPPTAFCNYFKCIPSFWNGHGFVNECQDGMYSLSGGISGDCSSHGGEQQPLYSH